MADRDEEFFIRWWYEQTWPEIFEEGDCGRLPLEEMIRRISNCVLYGIAPQGSVLIVGGSCGKSTAPTHRYGVSPVQSAYEAIRIGEVARNSMRDRALNFAVWETAGGIL